MISSVKGCRIYEIGLGIGLIVFPVSGSPGELYAHRAQVRDDVATYGQAKAAGGLGGRLQRRSN